VSNIRDSLQYDYASVVGGRLYYEIKGTGHPIVLIHAGFLDRRMWDKQFELFAKDFKVIRYDVRGFGKSSRPAEKYSDIEDLYTLLTSLKVEKTYLVGVSNGGRIAIDFTINHQSIVGALILVGSGVSGYETSEPEEDKAWAEFDKQIDEPQQLAAKQGRIIEAVMMDVEAWASAQSPSNRQRILEIATDNSHIHTDPPGRLQVNPNPPGFKRLAEIRIPTLVMIGDRDVRGMRFIAQQLHARIPGSSIVEVPGADHIVNMSQTRAFNRIVLDFLSNPV
jgi:pimeloyl-ACP methyl ester carboxylesterase